jgi:pyruvate kinase
MCNTVRKTKIVCTIGPATSSPEQLRQLIIAGMDVARLNFSHGDHESHRRVIRNLRRLSADLAKETGILQDLRGPKIRVGQLPDAGVELEVDATVNLVSRDTSEPGTLPIQYSHLLEDVEPGNRILLADGSVELQVIEKQSDHLVCRVLVGGEVHSRKGVNLPSSPLRIAAFTDKDRKDLELGLEEKVDFVALSFVRHEHDLEPVREILDRQDLPPMLIAKIERPQALDRLDAILTGVGGIMVARGDLGVEMPLAEVPMIQKRLIRAARNSGKPVITATQMLRSMVESPRPTRAEAADVANAVLDGTDAVMLSEETATGRYPVEAVQVLDRICRQTEPYLEMESLLKDPISDLLPPVQTAVSRSACWLARDIEAKAIVAFTASGSTARTVSRFRPPQPVIGLTHRPATKRQLSLSWGVSPVEVENLADTDEMFAAATSWILKNNIARKGDRIILTAGIPIGVPGTTNLLKAIELS